MRKTPFDVFINTPVTLDLDMRLRLAAAKQRTSRSEIVRQAMREYLARLDKKEKSNADKNDIQTISNDNLT